jgi:hypothetical protein
VIESKVSTIFFLLLLFKTGSHCVAQAELTLMILLLSASGVLGSQACATIPDYYLLFVWCMINKPSTFYVCSILLYWRYLKKEKDRNEGPCQALVAQTCNPSSSGGRDQEDCGLKPAWGK